MVWQVGRIGDRRSFFLATTLLPTSLQITPRFDTFLACLFFFLRCNIVASNISFSAIVLIYLAE